MPLPSVKSSGCVEETDKPSSRTGIADPHSDLRWAIYGLLIITSVGAMVGRIFAVQADHRRTPFLSANDRSRWCTIRALVDHGTYEIDDVIIDGQTGRFDRHWYTIDLVRHKGDDEREHFYSSKPTLLPTILAGQYWVLKAVFGVGIRDNPFYVGRFILIVSNVLPLILYFVLLARLMERLGKTDWGRLFVMTCATWGTFLTTFAVTLNNHLPAAISVLIVLYAALAIWYDGELRLRYFALAGFFSAFTAANELPALSFFVLVGAGLFWKRPRPTLVAFVPAAALVLAAFFYTNYLAHSSWQPPYAHRQDGPVLAQMPQGMQKELVPGTVSEQLRFQLNQLTSATGIEISPSAVLMVGTLWERDWKGRAVVQRWTLWDPEGEDRLAFLVLKSDLPVVHILAWDNWYDYEGSYWLPGRKTGIDLGEPSPFVYAFHLLLGHHGIFSLTPIWLLAIVGLAILLAAPDQLPGRFKRLLALIHRYFESRGTRKLLRGAEYEGFALGVLTLVLSVVCILFYLTRPLEDRNYGGATCGLRWLFWCTPMWLLCVLPAADAIASNWLGRGVALCLLAISVVSAIYGSFNPWIHPWIYTYLQYLSG